MRSTRNTVGGVFAAITAGISLGMAIWDGVSWIMTMSLLPEDRFCHFL